MTAKLKKIALIFGIVCFIGGLGLFTLISNVAHNHFKDQAFADMEMLSRVKRSSFETSMNEQLTLVLQLVKMPSMKEYLLNPHNENAKK